MAQNICHEYDDIIHLSRPVSVRHGRMSMIDRGAQFSPFAALVGYEAVIQESARLTEAETFLEEDGKMLLDQKLRRIAEEPENTGEVTFLIYEQDEKKSGGRFVPVTGCVKKIDLYRRTILLETGREFGIESIRAIECDDWKE